MDTMSAVPDSTTQCSTCATRFSLDEITGSLMDRHLNATRAVDLADEVSAAEAADACSTSDQETAGRT